MTTKEVALTMLAVGRLDFVQDVQTGGDGRILFVELSPRLIAVLPTPRHVLQVDRKDFTVQEVIRLYQVYIVEYLQEVTATAEEMLRSAKIQVKRGLI